MTPPTSDYAVDPESIQGYMPCVAVLAWNEKKEVPVVSRKDAPGLFSLAGGKVESHDGSLSAQDSALFYATLRRAAARELFEETGLKTDPTALELVFSTSKYEPGKKRHVFYWFARTWSGTLRPETGSTVQWSDPSILLTKSPWPGSYKELFEVVGVRF